MGEKKGRLDREAFSVFQNLVAPWTDTFAPWLAGGQMALHRGALGPMPGGRRPPKKALAHKPKHSEPMGPYG